MRELTRERYGEIMSAAFKDFDTLYARYAQEPDPDTLLAALRLAWSVTKAERLDRKPWAKALAKRLRHAEELHKTASKTAA